VATAGRRYEIRVDGVLDERWTEWFGPELLNESDETVLVGLIADQSALHGVLDKVRDMVLSVIDMRRLPSEDWTRKGGRDADDVRVSWRSSCGSRGQGSDRALVAGGVPDRPTRHGRRPREGDRSGMGGRPPDRIGNLSTMKGISR
jgi:hypothetical protein